MQKSQEKLIKMDTAICKEDDISRECCFNVRKSVALAGVAQWIERQPANLKSGCWFDSHSGHTPGLHARSPVWGVGEVTYQCFSHVDVSLPFLSPSLPRFLKSKYIK